MKKASLGLLGLMAVVCPSFGAYASSATPPSGWAKCSASATAGGGGISAVVELDPSLGDAVGLKARLISGPGGMKLGAPKGLAGVSVQGATSLSFEGLKGGDTVAIPLDLPAPSAAGDLIAVRIALSREQGSLWPASCNLAFEATPAGQWDPVPFRVFVDAWRSKDPEDYGAFLGGGIEPAPPKLAHVAPWDNPELAPEDVAKSLQKLGLGAPPTASVAGPLERTDGDVPQAAFGCHAAAPGNGAGRVALLVLLGFGGALWLRRRRAGALTLVAVFAGASLSPAPASAQSSCTFYGYVDFWDVRSIRWDQATDTLPRDGLRYGACDLCVDHVASNCAPGDPDCCFTPVRFAKVVLYRRDTSTPIDSDYTSRTGYYILQDPNCVYGTDKYRIELRYERQGFEGSFNLYTHPSWSTTDWEIASQSIAFVSTHSGYTRYYLGRYHANAFGDGSPPANLCPTGGGKGGNPVASPSGDIATIWESVNDVFYHLEHDEGETRWHHHYQGSGDDPINLYYDSADDATTVSLCDAHVLIKPADARRAIVPMQAGHIAHMRVLGCTAWADPEHTPTIGPWSVVGQPQDYEGRLQSAVALLVGMQGWWDPNTTSVASMRKWMDSKGFTGTSCSNAGSANRNDAAYAHNNFYALWEWIDTPTDGADEFADYVDVTIEDLFDAAQTWALQPCSSANHGRCEFDNTQQQSSEYCYDTNDCCPATGSCFGGPGTVCDKPPGGSSKRCLGPDAHGGNIADWAYWLRLGMGSTMPLQRYWMTLASSPCMGYVDDTWPFDGGFHSD